MRGPPKEVVHSNTRMRPASSATPEAAADGGRGSHNHMYGVVNERGIDANGSNSVGRAPIPGDSPKVGGYGFVA